METHLPQPDTIDSLLNQLNTACEQYTQAICTSYQAGTYTLAIKDAALAVNSLNQAIDKAPDVEVLAGRINDLIDNDILVPTDTRFPVIRHLLTLLNVREQEFINLVSKIQEQLDYLLDVVQVYYTCGESQQYEELLRHNTRQFLYALEEGFLFPLGLNRQP